MKKFQIIFLFLGCFGLNAVAVSDDKIDVTGLVKYQAPDKKYDPFFYYPETLVEMKTPEGMKKMYAEKEKVGVLQDRIIWKESEWKKAANDHLDQPTCDATAGGYKKSYATSFKTTEDKVKLVVAQAGVKKNPAFGGSDRDYCYIHLQLPYEQGMANVFIGMYHFQVFSGPMDVVTAIFDEGSVNADAFMRSVKAFSQK